MTLSGRGRWPRWVRARSPAAPAPPSPSPTISTRRGPAPSSPCRSREIAARGARTCACSTSWFATRKAARCPRRSPTTSTTTAARQYDDLVFSYDFAAGEKRAMFTLEPVASGHAARAALRLRARRAGALRRHGLGKRSHRASHVWLRAEHAGRGRRAPARQRHRRVGASASAYPIVDRWYAKGHDQFHKDEEGEGLDLYSIGGSRGAGGTGIWDGSEALDLRQLRERAGALERPAARGVQAHLRALGRGRRGQGQRNQARSRVDCGRNFDAVESVFDFAGATSGGRHRHHASIRRRRAFPRPCSHAIPRAAG